jgi:hypothetical protein
MARQARERGRPLATASSNEHEQKETQEETHASTDPPPLFSNESFTRSVTNLLALETVKGFLYEPLPDFHFVRLLQLEAGLHSTDLITHLHTANLNSIPESLPSGYEALSYVWGSQVCGSEVQDLYLNGQSVIRKTRQNLKDALKRVRLVDHPRLVWADAICINQEDIKERGHQVRLMRSIYRKANRVLVWLGKDDSDDAEIAFSVICSIVNSSPRHVDSSSKAGFRHRNGGWPFLDANEGIPHPGSMKWKSVEKLFHCQWFWRIWVIQEIVLAKSAVLMWGDFEIDWKWVGIAAGVIRINYYDVMRAHDMDGVYNAYFMHRISLNEQESQPLTFSFRELLGLTQQFNCTDPRDRIFGLLGLPTTDADPENGYLFVQPDYSLGLDELNKKLAWNMIHRDKTLQLLSSVQRIHRMNETIPSWIPQWQDFHTQSLSSTEPAFRYAASESMLFDQVSHPESDVLAVRGLSVDVVAEMARAWNWVPYDNDERARKRLIEDMVSHLETRPMFKLLLETSLGRRELCWTLSVGKSWDGQPVTDETSHLGDFRAFLRHFVESQELQASSLYERNLIPSDDLSSSIMEISKAKTVIIWEEYVATLDLPTTHEDEDGYRFWEAAANAYKGRQLFFTKDHCLGLGPSGMQKGDQICILFGGEVPFVLRQRDDYYILIGECYIESLMNGQAIDRWKNGELEDQLFEIH